MRTDKASTRLLAPYVRAYLLPFLGAIAFLSVESISDLLQPTIMSHIVDNGVAAGNLSVVIQYGLRMLAVAAIGAMGAIGRNIVASIVSYRFGARLRADLFAKITSFSFEELDGFDAASLITRQTNDVTQVQAFANGIMRFFAKAPILAVGGLVMAVILEPGLAVVLLVTVPLATVVIVTNLAMGFPRFRRVQEGLDGVNSVTREYLGGIRVVRAFAQERREVARFSDVNNVLTRASTTALRSVALFGPIITLVMNVGIVAVLWIGGYRVAGSGLQVGKIIAFINYMTQILFALTMISNIFTSFVRALASWERVGAVLRTTGSEPVGGTTDTDASPTDVALPRDTRDDARAATGVEVEFAGVSFSYPHSHGMQALSAVSFICGAGETTAIIGSTGSGKSTLASLVPRFYDCSSGSIRVGGIDVRDLDRTVLRSRIALVPQKTVLFTGTIAENLRWGRPDATDDELEAACVLAQAHAFVQGFPEGYETMLGHGGLSLSGGQKQRLAIARAIVRRPEVLILDDCTSAVDSVTEADILDGMKRASTGLTVVLITQRISAAAASDRVLVLDDGRAVGNGSHAGLLRECDVYRDLCIAQLGREAVDA